MGGKGGEKKRSGRRAQRNMQGGGRCGEQRRACRHIPAALQRECAAKRREAGELTRGSVW